MEGYASRSTLKLLRRCPITADQEEYAERWHTESDASNEARRRADDLGISSPTRSTAALITALVATAGAKAVVEVGTGTGVTGLAAFRGMDATGAVTTIDPDAQRQAAAKAAFAAAGHTGSRARLITGSASEVLPRLADSSYDIVVVNEAAPDETFLNESLRLLREGGVVVFTQALDTQRAAASAASDLDDTVTALLPVDGGILIVAKPRTTTSD